MPRNIFEGWHLVVLLLVIVILFGWKKLPDAARSIGRSMRIFKAEVEEMKRDDAPSAASQDTVRGNTVPPTSGAGATAAGAPAGTANAADLSDPITPTEAETPEARTARLREEARAKLDAEDAERARIEAELRAERAKTAADGPADPTL